jgi:hypothetical protein
MMTQGRVEKSKCVRKVNKMENLTKKSCEAVANPSLIEEPAELGKLAVISCDADSPTEPDVEIDDSLKQIIEKMNEEVERDCDSEDIINNLGQLLEAGADINDLVQKLIPFHIVDNLSQLLELGAKIDVNNLVQELHPGVVTYYLPQLAKAGAEIDINKLVERLGRGDAEDILENLFQILEFGADINDLVDKLGPTIIFDNLTKLVSIGARINFGVLIERLGFGSHDVACNLTKLLEAGADVDDLLDKLEPYDIADNLTQLIEAGANIDVNRLVMRLEPNEIARNKEQLLAAGANLRVSESYIQTDSEDYFEDYEGEFY